MNEKSRSPSPDQPLLVLSEVSFAYIPDSPVVADVTLTVQEGERVALMGANGSGKSTLVRLACGLIEPDAGSVFATSMAYVAQDPQANVVGESVQEDVAFGARLRGDQEARIARRVHTALRAVAMDWAADRPMSTLSGGEIQRVALAGAIASGARLWVLDEPTGHLPRQEARAFWRTVNQMSVTNGIGILYVTHQPQEARMADRIICIAQGRVGIAGRPHNVLWRAQLLERLGIRCDVALGLMHLVDPERIPRSQSAMERLEERAVEGLCSVLTR